MVADAAQGTANTHTDPAGGVLPDARARPFSMRRRGCCGPKASPGLSTRRVASAAGQPLSQIHYHFGSKQGLRVPALLDHIDEQALDRQRAMYGAGASLSARWFKACDFLDEDLASGYVRLLQECIALGWSHEAIAEKVRALFHRWGFPSDRGRARGRGPLGPLGPFSAAEIAALAGKVFLGARIRAAAPDRRNAYTHPQRVAEGWSADRGAGAKGFRAMTRACYPDEEGRARNGGVELHYEVCGAARRRSSCFPRGSRSFARVEGPGSFLSRHYRVLTYDARGNGKSDRPRGPENYGYDRLVADAWAVMDAPEPDRPGGGHGLQLGGSPGRPDGGGRPERILAPC